MGCTGESIKIENEKEISLMDWENEVKYRKFDRRRKEVGAMLDEKCIDTGNCDENH